MPSDEHKRGGALHGDGVDHAGELDHQGGVMGTPMKVGRPRVVSIGNSGGLPVSMWLIGGRIGPSSLPSAAAARGRWSTGGVGGGGARWLWLTRLLFHRRSVGKDGIFVLLFYCLHGIRVRFFLYGWCLVRWRGGTGLEFLEFLVQVKEGCQSLAAEGDQWSCQGDAAPNVQEVLCVCTCMCVC